MKRELAFALEAQSQLNCGSLGRTRSSKPQFIKLDFAAVVTAGSDASGTPASSQSNGVERGGLHVYKRNKRLKFAESVGQSVNSASDDLATTPVEVKIHRRFTRSALKDSGNSELSNDGYGALKPAVRLELNDGDVVSEATLKPTVGLGLNDDCGVALEAKTARRFTRSALKPVVEEEKDSGDLRLNGDADVAPEGTAPRRLTSSALKPTAPAEVELKVDNDGGEVVGSGDGIVIGTLTKKLELKMSKKIVLTERITTVRELFETGLLEGLPVFYHSVGKEGIKLRGVIRGIGILCTCSLCKGSRVIPPSQFEIHACKSYRRASQYICLENGKSLLQLLEICKRSAMETLEETIQTVTGPLPVKETNICLNCKGIFSLSSSVGICDVCKSSIDMEADRKPETTENARESERALVPQPLASATLPATPLKNSQQKRKRKSSGSDLIPKSPVSASVGGLSRSKRQKKKTKGLSKSASVPRSSKSATMYTSAQKKSQWRITKKDQNMHHVVFEEGGLPDGSELGYYSRGQKLLDGYKKGMGIFCFCCNTEVSASQFEAHAGWASRKKPYCYIYTPNGVSLHEYAVSLLKHRKSVSRENDDLCIICADGGNLLLCDGCPRAFHKECASLPSVPRGKWYCKYCENMFQREKFVEHNANAMAAGRVSGVDPIAEIEKRCIRIVKVSENVAVSCVLCRGYEFNKGEFGPTTVILCDQCEKEYHVGCLKKHKMANLKKLPQGKWYCSIDCKKMHSTLKNLVKCEPQMLQDTLMDLLRKKQSNSGLYGITDFGMRWRLLSGKIASRETKPLLSEAVAIFHECFDPIIDAESGKDFIPSMVYGGDIRGQDFRGMYSAVLTVNSSVVSAGILRIFGQDMAELPLVATNKSNQGKGYFQVLFSCIEELLISLNVKKIVLPSADEAEAIWINKFGFRKLSPQQLAKYRKTCSAMLIFKGTSMLEKAIPIHKTVQHGAPSDDLTVE